MQLEGIGQGVFRVGFLAEAVVVHGDQVFPRAVCDPGDGDVMPFAQRDVPVFQLDGFFFAACVVAQEKFVVGAGFAAAGKGIGARVDVAVVVGIEVAVSAANPGVDDAAFLAGDDGATKEGGRAAVFAVVVVGLGAAHGAGKSGGDDMPQDFGGDVAANRTQGVAEDAEQHADRRERRMEGGGDDGRG